MRKFHLITYGCQMNKNDSERIAGLLCDLGFSETKNPEKADFILMNTCSVRQSAEDRVFGNVLNFKKLKENNPRLVLGITGCMPGRDHDGKLRAKFPNVDLFFPITDLPQLPKWLAEYFPEIVNTDELKEDYLKLHPLRKSARQAYVIIQTGCNKFCTYCVVPFARGLERNRPVADIIKEIRDLAEQGCLEITLLGQTINSYRAPDPDNFSKDNPYHDHFAALFWEVNQVDGIKRIHFTAPHPVHMTDEVIDALTLPKQVNFIHLPVQAGDNEILRKMNRRYTAEEYLDIIKKIRAKKPNIAIGTDIIVGFCGETEEQFQRTVELYKAADFDISYTAMYSPRSGTTARKAWQDNISREEKKRRWQVLQDLMEKIVLQKNQKYIGKIVEVLVERFENGFCFGNSPEMKLVQFPGTEDLVGQIVPVKIEQVREWTLGGLPLDKRIKVR